MQERQEYLYKCDVFLDGYRVDTHYFSADAVMAFMLNGSVLKDENKKVLNRLESLSWSPAGLSNVPPAMQLLGRMAAYEDRGELFWFRASVDSVFVVHTLSNLLNFEALQSSFWRKYIFSWVGIGAAFVLGYLISWF